MSIAVWECVSGGREKRMPRFWIGDTELKVKAMDK
jgi:hypothetical protein